MQIPVLFAHDDGFWSAWIQHIYDNYERKKTLANIGHYIGIREEHYLHGLISRQEMILSTDHFLRGNYDQLGWMIELFYAQVKGATHRDELWSAWIGFDGVIKCMERTQHPLLEESFDRYEELLPHLLEEPEELLAYINHQSRPYALPRTLHLSSKPSQRFDTLTRWCKRNEIITYTRPSDPLERIRVESYYARRIANMKNPKRTLNDEEIFKLKPSQLNKVIDFMSVQLLGSSSRITSLDRFLIIDGLSLRGERLGVMTPDQSRVRFEAIKDHLWCLCEFEEIEHFTETFHRPYLS